MLIMALKDKVAKKFIQYVPTPSVDLLKRDLKNAVNHPGSIYNTNLEDFDCYILNEVDETTGETLSTNVDFAFNLADLKNDPQVQ